MILIKKILLVFASIGVLCSVLMSLTIREYLNRSLAQGQELASMISIKAALYLILLTLLLCAILGGLLIKMVLIPIRTIRNIFDGMNLERLQNRTIFELETRDEFEDLAIAFNDMTLATANRLQKLKQVLKKYRNT